MKENEMKKIFNAGSLTIMPGVTSLDIKMAIKELLTSAPFLFCLYGSSASLDFDPNDEISDYDLFTTMPMGLFKYITEGILERFPGIIVRGIEGMHRGTYRLRVFEKTFLDISVITMRMMNIFRLHGTAIEGTIGGFMVPYLFYFGEVIKILLRPGVSYSQLPFVSDADRPKWAKKMAEFKEIMTSGEVPTLMISNAECRKSKAGDSIVINNGLTFGGSIARTLYAHILGIEEVGLQSLGRMEDGNVHFLLKGANSHARAMVSYFTSNEVAGDDISYGRMFNGVLPEYVYITEQDILVYLTSKLPPDYVYCEVMLDNVPFILPSPLFLLMEAIMFQYLDIDHIPFQRGCSYNHHFDMVLKIMRRQDVSKYVRVIKPGVLRSSYQTKPMPFAYKFDKEALDRIVSNYNVSVSPVILASPQKWNVKQASTNPDYPRGLWGK